MNSQLAIALHTLGFLAARDGGPLTSEVIAHTYGTSPVVVRRVLAKLRAAGLVETRPGAGGGTALARPAAEITLRQAFEAVMESSHLMRRPPGDADSAVSDVIAAYIDSLYTEAEQAFLQRLEQVTVAEVDRQVRPRIIAGLLESHIRKKPGRSKSRR